LLKFDNEQVMVAMRYALLANQCPGLLNVIEHDLYQPNNMQMIFMASVDLCASPDFNPDELGIAREIFWHAQRMGRIGNMITTWEREVLDRDFTSGIFAFAVHRGILSAADLRNLPAHEIMSLLEANDCQNISSTSGNTTANRCSASSAASARSICSPTSAASRNCSALTLAAAA
jgi:hypothetical protein